MHHSTSFLGRYLAQKALRVQSRNDNKSVAYKTIPTAAMQAVPPLTVPGYIANEVVMNNVVQGNKPSVAKKILEKSRYDAERRSWKNQLFSGLKNSPAWALGGGLSGGLAGYLVSKYLNKDEDPSNTALLSALAGSGVGAAAPLAQAAFSKIVLDNTTNKDKRNAATFLSEHANKSSLPLGDVVGAAISK